MFQGKQESRGIEPKAYAPEPSGETQKKALGSWFWASATLAVAMNQWLIDLSVSLSQSTAKKVVWRVSLMNKC